MENYLLLELGVEEMPARFVESTLEQMKASLEALLTESRIKYDEIKFFATPRHLILEVDGISEKQSDLEEEVKGPSKKISVDSEGNLTKAALGFMRGKGLNESEVCFKDVSGEEYLFGTVKETGENSEKALREILPKVIRSVTFPKAMHWGGKKLKFARPIRWIVCLMNDNVLDFEIEGIVASNKTVGHRFLGEKSIEVKSIEDFYKKLNANYVIYDHVERKSIIKEQITEVAKSVGGEVEIDDELLNEVNYLVEYPTAFYGEFDEKYLNLPKGVVITPMKQHQRYFPVVKDGKLLPYFIGVRNGNKFKIENVKKGNEKVLEARLADALFFYNEDIKKNLDAYREGLKTVVFQADLGTVYDKTERLKVLTSSIVGTLENKIVKEVSNTDLTRAAELSKADLITNMVFEFDELQGYMGREYAKVSGENETVANAIFEHYLPRYSGDMVPTSMEGKILSIADKIDSIAGFFAVNIVPTGSSDPYALRRQALGILAILIDADLNLSIKNTVSLALDQFSNIEFEKEVVLKQVVDFFLDRIRVLFKEMGIRYDVVDAVINSNMPNLATRYRVAVALDKWLKNSELTDTLVAFNRVSTMAQKANNDVVKDSLLVEDAERELFVKFNDVKIKFMELIKQTNYQEALELMATLKPAIDNFFDNVMVMDKDENIKNNRLALLKQIYETVLTMCDLSYIVYK